MTAETLDQPSIMDRPSSKTSLVHLPDEVILTIAEFLNPESKDVEWYEPIERRNHVRTAALRDVLSLSTCCKTTRRIIFHESIMREALVQSTKKGLRVFASMPLELRSHIK
jgi:hypothetical protein